MMMRLKNANMDTSSTELRILLSSLLSPLFLTSAETRTNSSSNANSKSSRSLESTQEDSQLSINVNA